MNGFPEELLLATDGLESGGHPEDGDSLDGERDTIGENRTSGETGPLNPFPSLARVRTRRRHPLSPSSPRAGTRHVRLQRTRWGWL
jgi:hypothetical protein